MKYGCVASSRRRDRVRNSGRYGNPAPKEIRVAVFRIDAPFGLPYADTGVDAMMLAFGNRYAVMGTTGARGWSASDSRRSELKSSRP